MKKSHRGYLIAGGICVLLAAAFLAAAVWNLIFGSESPTPFVLCMIFGCIAAATAVVFAVLLWFSRQSHR